MKPRRKYVSTIECLQCSAPLPKVLCNKRGVHHYSCPYGYYIPCAKCGHRNNLSELLDFSVGCNAMCERFKDVIAPQLTR